MQLTPRQEILGREPCMNASFTQASIEMLRGGSDVRSIGGVLRFRLRDCCYPGTFLFVHQPIPASNCSKAYTAYNLEGPVRRECLGVPCQVSHQIHQRKYHPYSKTCLGCKPLLKLGSTTYHLDGVNGDYYTHDQICCSWISLLKDKTIRQQKRPTIR